MGISIVAIVLFVFFAIVFFLVARANKKEIIAMQSSEDSKRNGQEIEQARGRMIISLALGVIFLIIAAIFLAGTIFQFLNIG